MLVLCVYLDSAPDKNKLTSVEIIANLTVTLTIIIV